MRNVNYLKLAKKMKFYAGIILVLILIHYVLQEKHALMKKFYAQMALAKFQDIALNLF